MITTRQLRFRWQRREGTPQRAYCRTALSALAIALFALLAAQPAQAQLETEAARDARTALRNVEQTYGTRVGWETWSRRLAFEDIASELRLGDRARGDVMQSTAARLREGAETDFRPAALQQLADALERRATELAPIPAERWPAECERQAEKYKVITPQDVLAGRQRLLDRLVALERRLPAVSREGDPWRYFLSWPATWDLVYVDRQDDDLLDRLEVRWQGAPSVWDAPELVDAALAVQSYIRLYRAYLAHESKDQHAAAWRELGALLESHPEANSSQIAALVSQRERLGQASALTASIRREFSRANIILQARTKWVEEQLHQQVNERYEVNDVYAGARTYGNGDLSGAIRLEILPSSTVGHARLVLEAISRARTQGSSEGVSVSSTATTRVRGDKTFLLDARGLSTAPARVTADTSIVYNSINAPGFRRRRNEAIRRTHARRPQAEADAAAATRREIAARMNAEGDDLVAKFNRSYIQLRDRQFARHRRAPEVRISAGDGAVRWECRLESPLLFAAPGVPPEFDAAADVTLSIATSALEEQCLASLAGRQLTGAELSTTISELLGAPTEENKRGLDFTATFADRPCDIQFVGGQIRAKFYITSFDSDDVKYPAMTVDAQYNVEQREGDLALVRDGSLLVRPMAKRGEETPAISGRQQTLRLAVQRKLNRAMAETYLYASPALPVSGEEQPKLQITHAAVDGGWMQIALANVPAQTDKQASTARQSKTADRSREAGRAAN